MAELQLYIEEAPNRGKGVFTKAAIPADTVIEIAPVIVMTRADRDQLDKTILHDYIFEWQPYGEDMCCMAMGWIPLYNHSYTSNCEYFMDYDEHIMYIQAVRPIAAGEELTINYSGDWNETAPVWFDVK